MRKSIVLIPTYKPDSELLILVKELYEKNFKILVVNDGSGKKYNRIFEDVSSYAEVISHETNRGKGNALKTGIAYIKENYKDYSYFITADSDGQHLVSDILRVDKKLSEKNSIVLSTRILKGKIPLRSRFGNVLSRLVFTMLTGKYYIDNQSGLRGFSTEHCDWLLKVSGGFYDYEMNVLYFAEKQLIPITTINIDAVYIDRNRSSHFNPISDTLKIYKQLFYSARGTFMSFVLTEILLLISTLSVDLKYLFFTLPTIGIITVMFDIFFCIVFSMKEFKFKDYGRMLMRMAIKYSFYITFSWLIYLVAPTFPIFISFNLLMLLLMIPEFFILKTYYKLKLKKNKS